MMASDPQKQAPRDTQRVPRSCVQCSRRKIKCTKRIPCEACSRRSEAHLCSREVVRVNGQVTVALDPLPLNSSTISDVVNENLSLRARIEQLEVLLGREGQDIFSPDSSSSVEYGATNPHPPEDLVTTFERLHLVDSHLDGTPRKSRHTTSIVSPAPGRHVLSLLPVRASSSKIVRFSLETLGWVHCALNGPRFLAEHDCFWNALEMNDTDALQNHCWLAIYFSVLAVGAYFLDEISAAEIHYLHEGFSGQQAPATEFGANGLMDISHVWYDAAFEHLNQSHFFSKPHMSTVQALAILMILHRNFGESHREYFLLGLAVNIARSLGMDHLGQEGDSVQGLITRSEWSTRSAREVGRRLWWTLVICDWMTVFSRPSSIMPESFSSMLSTSYEKSTQGVVIGSPDELFFEGMVQLPSPLEYHIVLAKVATIIHTHVRNTATTPMSVFKALEEIRRISHSLPLHLQTLDDASSMHQYVAIPWIETQRIQLNNLLELCQIDLCFSCLPRLLDTGEDEFNLQARGLQSATRLASERSHDSLGIVKKFWGTTAGLIAAGVYLILDLICFKGNKSSDDVVRQEQRINYCIRLLEQNATANVAGAPILLRLLHLSEIELDGEAMNKKRLLQVMKLAAIPIVKSTEKETSFGNDNSYIDDAVLQQHDHSSADERNSGLQNKDYGLAFGLVQFGDVSNSSFAMDLDYMSFDDLPGSAPFDFAGTDFNYFKAYEETELH